MKFWIGHLGKTAKKSMVFAQLITKGVDYGVHVFIVDIRDDNHDPFPGVEIGDIGLKNGADGVDNGWMMFDNYKIPRTKLLNRYADVKEDGTYVSEIKSNNKRFALHMTALSTGRHAAAQISVDAGLVSTIIAMRYAATRK